MAYPLVATWQIAPDDDDDPNDGEGVTQMIKEKSRLSLVAVAVWVFTVQTAQADKIDVTARAQGTDLYGTSLVDSHTTDTANSIFNVFAGVQDGRWTYPNPEPAYGRSAGATNGLVSAGAQYLDHYGGNNSFKGEAVYVADFTNTDSTPQSYKFHFNINQGYLGVIGAGRTAHFSFLIESLIYGFGSGPSWYAQADVTGTANSSNSLVTLGEASNMTFTSYSRNGPLGPETGYDLDPFTFDYFTQNVLPGETFHIQYVLSTWVDGTGFGSGARAQIGDPFDLSKPAAGVTAITKIPVVSSSVPEPATLTLFAASAWLAVCLRGRRRQRGG